VREALFSVLGGVDGASVLELYAGSGALGIEALSRGAAHATFVESARSAIAVLQENLTRLALQKCSTVVTLPVERSATALLAHAPYDLVLCDPPWQELERATATVARLLAPGLLAPGARVVVEHPTRQAVALTGRVDLDLGAVRHWGDTAVSIFSSRADAQTPESKD
jgi:16S rRNA (guanine966-N2)-methyltransferase